MLFSMCGVCKWITEMISSYPLKVFFKIKILFLVMYDSKDGNISCSTTLSHTSLTI